MVTLMSCLQVEAAKYQKSTGTAIQNTHWPSATVHPHPGLTENYQLSTDWAHPAYQRPRLACDQVSTHMCAATQEHRS